MDKEAIKKALDEATPGPWEWNDVVCAVFGPNDCVADQTTISDGHLIANAPTWLRELLEENDRLRETCKRACEQKDKIIKNMANKNIQAGRERDAYREALEWYAGHRFDDGQRARQALGKEQTT